VVAVYLKNSGGDLDKPRLDFTGHKLT